MNCIRANLTVVLLSFVVATTCLGMDTGEAVKKAIFERYDLDPEHYQVEIASCQLKSEQVDPADLTFRAFSPKEPLGSFTIYARIERDGVIQDKGQVRLIIKRFVDVLVAADKIRRHQALLDTDFELKRMNVTSLREQPVCSAEALGGQRSKKNLRIGDILTTGAIEPVPDIEVGGEVTIIYSDHWGQVTVPGKVLQDGRSGETVRVKNRASGKIILARVIDNKSVTVGP